AQCLRNIAQTVVAALAPATLQFYRIKRHINLVMHNNNSLRRDAEKTCDRRNGSAGDIHKRLRLRQHNFWARDPTGQSPQTSLSNNGQAAMITKRCFAANSEFA